MKRRAFFQSIAVAVAAATMPCVAAEEAAEVCAGNGAYLAAKMAEMDALYEELARQLAVVMWGSSFESVVTKPAWQSLCTMGEEARPLT